MVARHGVARHGRMADTFETPASRCCRRRCLCNCIWRCARGAAVVVFPHRRARLRHRARRHGRLARAAGFRSARHPHRQLHAASSGRGRSRLRRQRVRRQHGPARQLGTRHASVAAGELRLVAQQHRRLSRRRRPALPRPAAAEPDQLDGLARRHAGGRPRRTHARCRASRAAPGPHRAGRAADGHAGRVPGERRARRLHDRAGPHLDHAKSRIINLSLRFNDDTRRADAAGISQPRRDRREP